ncbi:hypothetical protein [Thioalkalivibrio sp. AKL17]|uniref:hypothetical protein n=1 Tax=Thioalkalivibrio sp. AKL17 TaxID=1158160 RepID=UPI000365D5B8|nr:hypothetical protein [Thioalkalivibrio sp. AKL17]
MKGFTKPLLMLALFLPLLAVPAHALDGDTIDRWLAATEELNEWSAQQPDVQEPEMDAQDDEASMAEVRQAIEEVARMEEEVEEIAARHGFDSSHELTEIGSQIFNARHALEMERRLPEMERELDESLQRIEDDPDMPAEQKATMRDALEQQREMLHNVAPDVPEQDVEAVRSREDELEALFSN